MDPKIYPANFITVEDFKRGYPDFEDRKKPDGIPVEEIKVFLRVLYSKKAAALMVTEVGQVAVACVQPIEAVLLAPIIQIAGKINCGELIGRTVDDFKAREVFGVYDNHSEKKKAMPKIEYQSCKFSASSRAIIDKANEIIADYQAQGFELTLRQLYYQFVARDLIRNSQQEYKRLGSIINDARLAGLIDWLAIVDRTRNVRGNNHWESPAEIVKACAEQFRFDLWADQDHRPEVWIEKDALVGVIEDVCRRNDVNFFSCRGYTSQSEMWASAMRYHKMLRAGQRPVIIHLGDHDPSGKDMTNDIDRRMELFMGGVKIKRVALNYAQIEQYNPPPNPAKITDSRAKAYIEEFGGESWELDALEPKVIAELIQGQVDFYRDPSKWNKAVKRQEAARKQLRVIAKNWEKK